MSSTDPRARGRPAGGVQRCRRKFHRYFPRGFQDETYLAWERHYKWEAHLRWEDELGADSFHGLLRAGDHAEIARRAVRIESRTNLLFSFEKMALRDAVRSPAGARDFSLALYDLLHGSGQMAGKFERWCEALGQLPRRQTRVLTWPLATVCGFIAQPRRHMFLKPMVTRRAVACCGYHFDYASRPSWTTYAAYLQLAAEVRRDLKDWHPRDLIDIQSFLWVQGSDEYP